MIETNLRRVNFSANLQGSIKSNTSSNLYNTPLRELFEEAMKKAYEQYKKTRPELEASKDSKENPQNTAILHAQGEKFDLMSEKIKEAIRRKFEQSVENGVNSALNLANDSSNSALNSVFENQNSTNPTQANAKNSSIEKLKMLLGAI